MLMQLGCQMSHHGLLQVQGLQAQTADVPCCIVTNWPTSASIYAELYLGLVFAGSLAALTPGLGRSARGQPAVLLILLKKKAARWSSAKHATGLALVSSRHNISNNSCLLGHHLSLVWSHKKTMDAPCIEPVQHGRCTSISVSKD